MKTWTFCRGTSALAGFIAAAALSSAAVASNRTAPVAATPATTRHYVVSIDEIGKTFISNQPFTGSYATTVTLSNGSQRSIKLTPTTHDGMLVVHLQDLLDGKPAGPNGDSYMGPNGSTHDGTAADGTLMVKLQAPDYPPSAWKLVPPLKMVLKSGDVPDPATTRFIVSIYQITKTDAFAQRFTHRYAKTVAMADGPRRKIELAAAMHHGKGMLKLDDNGRISWLKPGATKIEGDLMIQTDDMDRAFALFKQMEKTAKQ